MKTIIITGANSGIGYETAKDLALKGNTIIAASRKKKSTLQIIQELNEKCKSKSTNGKVLFYDLDLSSLKSVKNFAEQVKKDFSTIDILICNAGIMNTPYKLTEDGFESQFQTNHLSHFYLTILLIDTIIKSNNPKILNLCSASAEKGTIDSIEKLNSISCIGESEYHAMTSYRESKLAQQTSVFYLSRLEKYKQIKFSLIHPGIVNTNLFYRNSGLWYKIVMLPFVYLGYLFGFFITPKKGAQTTIYLAEDNDYESGHYWNQKNRLTPNPISQNPDYSEKLWNWTIKILDKSR